MLKRREIVLGASSLAIVACAKTGTTKQSKPVAPKKGLSVLILGGTKFLGPHTVDALRAKGHAVTLFNRGKTNPGLFPDLEKLQGDRKNDLKALENRQWDAVIDTSAYVPADVTRSAKLLANNVGQYLLISTESVYASFATPGMDETASLATVKDPNTDVINEETYGGLKALCEKAAEAELPLRTTVLRPGLIVGPLDQTGRFTYWPVRVAKGGEVLAPGAKTHPTQFVDVRDVANFIVRCLEQQFFGIYNVDAAANSLTMGAVMNACKVVSGSDATFTWVGHKFLDEQKVSPWGDMPAWIPPVDDYRGFGQISVAKAIAAGLQLRPLELTVRDTLEWYRSQPVEMQSKLAVGISAEREAQVLKAWHAHKDAKS
jgi:2'-hydroxyisoflavone reductase